MYPDLYESIDYFNSLFILSQDKLVHEQDRQNLRNGQLCCQWH